MLISLTANISDQCGCVYLLRVVHTHVNLLVLVYLRLTKTDIYYVFQWLEGLVGNIIQIIKIQFKEIVYPLSIFYFTTNIVQYTSTYIFKNRTVTMCS